MATNYLWFTGHEESAIALSKNQETVPFLFCQSSLNLKWFDCYNVYLYIYI